MGSPVSCSPPGTFFTIYDFAGYMSSSASESGWGITTQSVGLTPSTLLPPDDGTLTNITFFYTAEWSTRMETWSSSGIRDRFFAQHGRRRMVYESGHKRCRSRRRYNEPDRRPRRRAGEWTGNGSLGGPVPEPGTIYMLLLGCAGIIASLRRKRN